MLILNHSLHIMLMSRRTFSFFYVTLVKLHLQLWFVSKLSFFPLNSEDINAAVTILVYSSATIFKSIAVLDPQCCYGDELVYRDTNKTSED